MNRIMKTISFFMAGTMSFLSPMTMSHGESGCCAECTFKKEEDIEVVYDEEDNKEGRKR